MPKVLVPLATGFEEIEAVSMIDIMRRGGIEVLVWAINYNMEVVGANGITLKAEGVVDGMSADDIDMIALPGGWGGTYALAEDENVQKLLKAMDAKGKDIGAICAAPFALKTAGVLKETYTCYPSVEDEIKQEGYLGDTFQVVQTDNVMTSRGPGTAICFGLAIVKRLMGEEKYNAVKEGTLSLHCE
ncbi:MAG: DJ-1/PfpI family protein [Helicobacteraceae bacterium]|jgi:4-methyl-5(b-hydroxyethyl)-thiazole monophosphate biosynthesis|nr:DJ-1/PfpI family protein [Helicobacteraceae bacterium]